MRRKHKLNQNKMSPKQHQSIAPDIDVYSAAKIELKDKKAFETSAQNVLRDALKENIQQDIQKKALDLQKHIPFREVKRGDTVLTVVASMKQGDALQRVDNINRLGVEFRKGSSSENFANMFAKDLPKIYPGQKVWVEDGKIIVADEMPHSSKKTEVTEKGTAEQAADKEKSPEKTQKIIENIEFYSDENFNYVKIKSDEPLNYVSGKKQNPLALVLLFPGAKFEKIPSLSPSLDSGITSINSSLASGGKDARIEIKLKDDFSDDFSYEMIKDKTDLIIKISKPNGG